MIVQIDLPRFRTRGKSGKEVVIVDAPFDAFPPPEETIDLDAQHDPGPVRLRVRRFRRLLVAVGVFILLDAAITARLFSMDLEPTFRLFMAGVTTVLVIGLILAGLWWWESSS